MANDLNIIKYFNVHYVSSINLGFPNVLSSINVLYDLNFPYVLNVIFVLYVLNVLSSINVIYDLNFHFLIVIFVLYVPNALSHITVLYGLNFSYILNAIFMIYAHDPLESLNSLLFYDKFVFSIKNDLVILLIEWQIFPTNFIDDPIFILTFSDFNLLSSFIFEYFIFDVHFQFIICLYHEAINLD
jgi:hypothetical protein